MNCHCDKCRDDVEDIYDALTCGLYGLICCLKSWPEDVRLLRALEEEIRQNAEQEKESR